MDAYDDDEWKDSDSEDATGDVKPTFIIQPSYVLIAIDVDDTMFVPNDSNQSAFYYCLEACFRLYNSLVLADRGSVKGPVCIILANNDAGKATFIDFDQPIPDSLKLLKDLKLLPNKELKDKYLRESEFDLGDFFLFCKNKLSTITGGVHKKSVYYITNNDNPVFNDAQKRFKIINESQKFAALQISLFVATFKSEFDSETLYSEVLSAANSPSVAVVKNVDHLTSEISDLVKRKFTKYRIKFYPFPGDTESYLDLVINKFVKAAKTIRNMHVTRDTQKEVKKLTKKPLYTTEYTCLYNDKEPSLVLNDLEKSCLMETNLPVGLTLLYVNNETFKKGWVIEPLSLIEKHYSETRIIFDAFWQYCKENSKCLVCLRKYKKGGDIRYMELVPKFVNNRRMFLAKAFPFSTDIHYTPQANVSAATFTDQEKNIMRSLVDTLTFDYDPTNFSDPVESKRKAYIKSQLLDEPLEVINDGLPTDEAVDEQIHYFVNQFRSLDLIGNESGGKRSNASSGGTSKKPRAKK